MKFKVLLITSFLLLASPAFASEVTFSPTSGTDGQAVTNHYPASYSVNVFDPNGDSISCGSSSHCVYSDYPGHTSITLDLTGLSYGQYTYNVDDGSGIIESGDAYNYINPNPPPTYPIWMPNPQDLIASVTASVQQTGAILWQLIQYLGIPIAFILCFYLLELIFGMVRSRAIDKYQAERAEKKYRVGTSDEYPKKERDAFIEAVDIYNKAHPDS